MQANSTAMGVVGSHCVSNEISFSCSFSGGNSIVCSDVVHKDDSINKMKTSDDVVVY